MRSVFRIISLTIGLLVLLSVGGCEVPPQGGRDVNNTANNNSAPAQSASNSNASAANRAAITLPVLDAFFADQGFAGELKSRLQLTDEQVAELKRIAQESRERMRQAYSNESYQGTTTDAHQRATSQIEAVIGREKMEQLFALVHERWGGNGENASALSATPGSVPQDTRVVVNAPAFRMDVFNNGQLVQSYKIGIGYPEFPLPTGLRHADTIIFNPTWTPPDEPWVESPGSKVKVGETVEAGDKLNPLGLAKIPIGLPSLIHGGKSPARIGSFASHGCVGLTDPQLIDFAKRLAQIGGATLTDAQIAKYRKNRSQTQEVKLSSTVPVELRYETITVEDGKLHIYRDVYDRNTNTEENLRAVLQAYGVSLDQLSEAERSQALAALEQMSRDVATGKPDTQETTANTNSANRNSSGRVTRNIKGQKEVVIQIAALQGKGYPAPIGIE